MKIFNAAGEILLEKKGYQTRRPRHLFGSFYAKFMETTPGKRASVSVAEELSTLARKTDFLIVDSGAHSIFKEVGSSTAATAGLLRTSKKAMSNIDGYMEAYLETAAEVIREHSNVMFVELDIGELVGMDKQLSWRTDIEREGLADRFIIVYHTNTESLESFKAAARSWPARYVALEGVQRYRTSPPYVSLVRWCYEHGIRCHGFAMTKFWVLTSVPFYSVDSSTFLRNTQRFGVMPVVYYDRKTGIIKSGQVKVADIANPAKRAGVLRLLYECGVPADVAERVTMHRTGEDTSFWLDLGIRMAETLEDRVTRYWKGKGIDWEKVDRNIENAAETRTEGSQG